MGSSRLLGIPWTITFAMNNTYKRTTKPRKTRSTKKEQVRRLCARTMAMAAVVMTVLFMFLANRPRFEVGIPGSSIYLDNQEWQTGSDHLERVKTSVPNSSSSNNNNSNSSSSKCFRRTTESVTTSRRVINDRESDRRTKKESRTWNHSLMSWYEYDMVWGTDNTYILKTLFDSFQVTPPVG